MAQTARVRNRDAIRRLESRAGDPSGHTAQGRQAMLEESREELNNVTLIPRRRCKAQVKTRLSQWAVVALCDTDGRGGHFPIATHDGGRVGLSLLHIDRRRGDRAIIQTADATASRTHLQEIPAKCTSIPDRFARGLSGATREDGGRFVGFLRDIPTLTAVDASMSTRSEVYETAPCSVRTKELGIQEVNPIAYRYLKTIGCGYSEGGG